MNHSIKTLVIAAAFFASLAIAASAEAAPQITVRNLTNELYTTGSTVGNPQFKDASRAEPGDTLEFQLFGGGGGALADSFELTLPSDLTYASTSFSNPTAIASVNGQTVRWTFTTSDTTVIRLTATVASGTSLSASHSLSVSFTADTPATSNSVTITTGPIVTSVTPKSARNLNAVPITIAGHGFVDGATAVSLSDGTILNLGGATITSTSISGLNIPALQPAGAYWVLVTVTASGNELITNADSTETVQYTVDMTPPTASVSYTQNSASIISAKAGDVTITVTFDEPIQATPQISISQQGSAGVPATNLEPTDSDSVWTYMYTVNADDGSLYIDGEATVTISNALDVPGNAFVGPASNNTFTIDTAAPSPAISTLAAAATGQTSATFSWTPTYTASDFSTYKFYWSTASGVTSANGTLVSVSGATTSSTSLSGLSAGTNYYGVIYICDAADNCSLASNEASVQTQQNAVIPAPTSGGGGGGSSGPAPTYQTYNPSTGELTVGEETEEASEGQILGSTVGAYPNGTLLKAPDAPAVWHIAAGQKHLLRSAAIFESRFNWNALITLPSSLQLALYEQGSDVKFAAGTLVKIMGEPAVFRVSADGGVSPVVSGEVFLGRGWSFDDVIEVEAGLLTDYTRLAAITDAETLYDGDLVKLADNPAVYYVESGAARLIPSSDIFHENAFKFKNVRTISSAVFGELASGIAFTYPDGTLVKGETPAVYVISDGAKRPILSGADFEALLYDWNEIRYVPETLLAAIPEAASIRIIVAAQ